MAFTKRAHGVLLDSLFGVGNGGQVRIGAAGGPFLFSYLHKSAKGLGLGITRASLKPSGAPC